MAEFPALPLWTDALIGDTNHLTPTQFGAYMRLLIAAWRSADGSLPNDDVFLGRCVGDQKNWHRIKPVIMVLPFFGLGEDGRYRQKRLLDERDYCSRTAARASAGGRAKALKRQHRGSAKTVLNVCLTPAPTPTPTPTTESWVRQVSDAIGFDITARTNWADQIISLRRLGIDPVLDLVPVILEMKAGGRLPPDIRGPYFFKGPALTKKEARLAVQTAQAERANAPFEDTDEKGWRQRTASWLDCGYWPPKCGPRPLTGLCKCPQPILATAVARWEEQGGHPAGSFPADPNGRYTEWKSLKDLRNDPDVDYGNAKLGDNVVTMPRRSA